MASPRTLPVPTADEVRLIDGRPIQFGKAPSNVRGGLQRYIENGILPGSFLTAFLSNDLMDAMGRADDVNKAQFFEIASFLYNYAPSQCYGSVGKVQAWVTARRQVAS